MSFNRGNILSAGRYCQDARTLILTFLQSLNFLIIFKKGV